MSQDKTNAAVNPRRKFLGNLGLMGAGAVLAGCAPGMAQTPGGTTKKNRDVAIFNFALNLEYLEAAYYLAATGRLSELSGIGGNAEIRLPSNFNGSASVDFPTDDIRAYANETATDELNHVKVIRSVLGAAAVDRPVIDLSTSFSAAGAAASGNKIMGFNPFASELAFLLGSFIFEDVGVTAYKGAARLLVDDSAGGNLENAAGILAVEAYHAGLIRTILYGRRASPVAAGLNVAQVAQAISDLRDSVDGSSDDDQGVVAGTGNPSYVTGANIVLADTNSIAFSRTPRQVANIVFLKAGAASGGFFPNGVNAPSTDPGFADLLSL